MAKQRFCTNCGSKMPPSAIVCRSCGAVVEGTNTTVATKRRNTWVVVVISAAVVLFALILIPLIGGIGKDSSGTYTSTDSSNSTATPSTDTKTEAKITLDKFDTVVNEYNQVENSLQGVVSGLADGSEDPATAYDDLNKLNSQALKVFSDANSLQVIDRYSQPKETLITSSSLLQNGIKELRDYLDTPKTSTLSEAKDDLQQASNGINLVNTAVATQAIKDGYTPPTDKK